MATGGNGDHVSPYNTRAKSSATKRALKSSTGSTTSSAAKRSRSSAKKRSINASSTVCGVVPMFNMLKLITGEQQVVDTWVSSRDVEEYDLSNLFQEYKVVVNAGEKPERSCMRLVKELLRNGGASYRVGEGILLHNFKSMHMAIYSAWHKPDVAIYWNDHLILILEVHSCSKRLSFPNTIRKLILGLTDLLRYYSNMNQTVTSCKGLVVPKHGSKTYAVEVTVEFKNFTFNYTLQEIAKEQFCERLQSVYAENKAKIGNVKLYPFEKFEFYIKLSMATMEMFGRDCKQVAAKEAIMFKADDHYYKVPVTVTDFMNIRYYQAMYDSVKLKNFIELMEVPKYPIFKYLAVRHDPLSRKEAGLCLGHLVGEIHEALGKLHEVRIHHCDVRLENICFGDDYSLMFIDMDRSMDIVAVSDDRIYPDSCMYNLEFLREGRMDWLQLGCLILWVVTGNDYHKQTILGLEHPITSNTFFLKLWKEGQYSEVDFQSFQEQEFCGKRRIQDVLTSRVNEADS